jgi:hypothetical protein
LEAGWGLPWPGKRNSNPKLTAKTKVRNTIRKGAIVEESKANWQMISKATKYSSSRLGLGRRTGIPADACQCGGGVVAMAMLQRVEFPRASGLRCSR